ncbi:helix-turn-helix domain-containing protein [Nocardia sp. NPDC051570]|uniref:helix-turn-helix domain-containing protein n=1 Tax=Nocardia sp. NPDC051570 TaxID=3364324 RepID=UPI0037990A06
MLQNHITVTEAAKRLSVSRQTVHRYIDQGLLPAQRVGTRDLRIDPAHLANLITEVS